MGRPKLMMMLVLLGELPCSHPARKFCYRWRHMSVVQVIHITPDDLDPLFDQLSKARNSMLIWVSKLWLAEL
jgi:hypothetical protein